MGNTLHATPPRIRMMAIFISPGAKIATVGTAIKAPYPTDTTANRIPSMAAAALAVGCFGSCPTNDKAAGQPIGKGKVLFMGSRSHLFGLDSFKRRQEFLLVSFIQRSVCRGKQAVVLFLDVLPEESDVALAVLNEPLQGVSVTLASTVDGPLQPADVETPKLVLTQHDRHRAATTAESTGLHQGE